MEEKKMLKVCEGLTLVIIVGTLLLSVFYNSAFVPSFMLMLSLFVFEICYEIKDSKKSMLYFLFVVGVLLVFGSLLYTFMRLR